MSNVVFRVVGEGDISRLESMLNRLESRLESVENKSRRAQAAANAAAQAEGPAATGPLFNAISSAGIQSSAQERLFFERIRQQAKAAPTAAATPNPLFEALLRPTAPAGDRPGAAESRALFERIRQEAASDARTLAREFFDRVNQVEPYGPWQQAGPHRDQFRGWVRGGHHLLPGLADLSAPNVGGGFASGHRGLPSWWQRMSPAEMGRGAWQALRSIDPVQAAQGVGSVVNKLNALASQSILTVGAVALLTATVAKHAEGAYDARAKVDRIERSVEVSTGIARDARGSVMPKIFDMANEFAMPVDFVQRLLDSLVRTEVPVDEAYGSVGRKVLELSSAMNVTGGPNKGEIDPSRLSSVLTGMMMAEGVPFTEQNADKMGRMLRTTYEGKLEMGDLPQLVEVMKFLKEAGVPLETGVAGFATLIDMSMSPDTASTAMRNITGRLKKIRGSHTAMESLAQLGLSPEDVDLEGEGLSTALSRLKIGSDRLGQPRATIALTKIFEELGVAHAMTLMSPDSIKRMNRYEEKMKAPEPLERFARFNQEGPAAAAVRLENQEAETTYLKGGRWASYYERMRLSHDDLRRQGAHPALAGFLGLLGESNAAMASLFVDPELASRWGSFLMNPLSNVEERMQANRGGAAAEPIEVMKGMHKELKNIARNTAKTPPAKPLPKPGVGEKDPP